MSGQEQLRARFESWWILDEQTELRKSCAKGWAEHVWFAALDLAVIELPPALADDLTLIAAIEASGVRVKP